MKLKSQKPSFSQKRPTHVMNPEGPDRLPVVCSDPVPDLIDHFEEDDEGNAFNEFNEKYVYLAPKQFT